MSYCFERDGADDVVGIVLDTSLGGFAVWLPLGTAVQLASQLVDIAEHAPQLRKAYAKRLQEPGGLNAGRLEWLLIQRVDASDDICYK